MDFNTIKVSGDVKHNITQVITFRSLAIGLVVAALILAIGFSPWGYKLYLRICGETYWVTGSTHKIHRKGCIYYGKGKGVETYEPAGENCKVCGGTGK